MHRYVDDLHISHFFAVSVLSCMIKVLLQSIVFAGVSLLTFALFVSAGMGIYQVIQNSIVALIV